MKRRRLIQAVMFSGVLAGSAFAVASPASAGSWTTVPCPRDGETSCTDGDQVYTIDVGMWKACDSSARRYAGGELDGVEQISPNGTLKCYIVRGTKG